METITEKNTATLMQLSAMSQYFFPLGNFIFPTLIWSMKKKESAFVDANGKQLINFQLSLLVYSLTLVIITIPILLYSIFNNIDFTLVNDCEWIVEKFSAGEITGIVMVAIVATLLWGAMKVLEFFLLIYAAVRNSNGEVYKYPLTINFIK